MFEALAREDEWDADTDLSMGAAGACVTHEARGLNADNPQRC
jgi:hypothetical protein